MGWDLLTLPQLGPITAEGVLLCKPRNACFKVQLCCYKSLSYTYVGRVENSVRNIESKRVSLSVQPGKSLVALSRRLVLSFQLSLASLLRDFVR